MDKVKGEIYFPEIEVYDSNWLKYALLYKEGITSMIPKYQDKYFSESHKFIQEQTGFFNYFDDFKHFRNVNNKFKGLVLDLEEMNENWDFDPSYSTLHDCFLRQEKSVEILNGKMTNSLEEDLVKLGYGVWNKGSFFVSRNLATLYMGMMAESIASKRGLKVSSTQTRYQEYQSMLENLSLYGYEEEEGIIIKNQDYKVSIVAQSLPTNIEKLTFQQIVRLRNKGDYQTALTSYNKLLLKIDDYIIEEESSEIEKSEILEELTSKRSIINTLIQTELGTEIFSYAFTSMVPISPTPLLKPFVDVGTSYMISKSAPYVRNVLQLPNIGITHQEIKSAKYLQSSWRNIDN